MDGREGAGLGGTVLRQGLGAVGLACARLPGHVARRASAMRAVGNAARRSFHALPQRLPPAPCRGALLRSPTWPWPMAPVSVVAPPDARQERRARSGPTPGCVATAAGRSSRPGTRASTVRPTEGSAAAMPRAGVRSGGRVGHAECAPAYCAGRRRAGDSLTRSHGSRARYPRFPLPWCLHASFRAGFPAGGFVHALVADPAGVFHRRHPTGRSSPVTPYLHRSRHSPRRGLPSGRAHVFRFWSWLSTAMVIRNGGHPPNTTPSARRPRIRTARSSTASGKCCWTAWTCTARPAAIARPWRSTAAARLRTGWAQRLRPLPGGGPDPDAAHQRHPVRHGGLFIWALQMIWIPFGRGCGQRPGSLVGLPQFPESDDTSTNLTPWGVVIGEELHNNHHTFPSSAKFALRKWEFDLGWAVIRAAGGGPGQVLRVAPSLDIRPNVSLPDGETIKAMLTHRFRVTTDYFRVVIVPTLREEAAHAGRASRPCRASYAAPSPTVGAGSTTPHANACRRCWIVAPPWPRCAVRARLAPLMEQRGGETMLRGCSSGATKPRPAASARCRNSLPGSRVTPSPGLSVDPRRVWKRPAACGPFVPAILRAFPPGGGRSGASRCRRRNARNRSGTRTTAGTWPLPRSGHGDHLWRDRLAQRREPAPKGQTARVLPTASRCSAPRNSQAKDRGALHAANASATAAPRTPLTCRHHARRLPARPRTPRRLRRTPHRPQ